MPDLPSRVELFNVGADEVLARSAARPPGQRLTAEEIFTEGSDINLVVASASAMGDETLRQLALRLKALTLDGAEDEDLDRLVADRTNGTLPRKEASPAVATVVITRAAGALPAVVLPVGTRWRTQAGIEFESTAIATLALGSNGPVSVPVQAVVAGLAGNVAAGAINQFSEVPSDPELLATNPEPAAGGDDRETDPRYRARARNFYLAARRGTIAAIEFGALTVAGVRQAVAVEEVDAGGDPTGRVALYIADAQGNGNAALVAAVRNALLEYRAAGIIVDIYGSVPVFQAIRYRLRFTAGTDTTAAFDSVRMATVAGVNALRPGDTLPVSLLFAAARSVPGVIVLDDAVQEPVGDVMPAAGTVIRTRADLVSAE